MNSKDIPFTQEISRGFGGLHQKLRTKTKYIFVLCHTIFKVHSRKSHESQTFICKDQTQEKNTLNSKVHSINIKIQNLEDSRALGCMQESM